MEGFLEEEEVPPDPEGRTAFGEDEERAFQVFSERWNPTFTYAFIHGVQVYCHCLVRWVLSASVQKQVDTPLSPLSIKLKWKGHYVTPDTCIVHRGWEPALERPGSCSSPAPITSWAFPESWFPAA